jgi:phospholipase/carboxylesterase
VVSPHHNQPVVLRGEPLETAAGAIVFLHGRGASAEDILGLAEEFDLGGARIAYAAPQAAGNTWYPNSFLAPIRQNEPYLSSALESVAATIAQVGKAGLALDKIALVGFSQGACLATEFVARHPARYAALVAFTGGLIGPEGTEFSHTGDLHGTPCFLGSGDPDPHVPWTRVQESAEVLRRLGGAVTLKRYPGMPHTVSRDEILEAGRLLAPFKKS